MWTSLCNFLCNKFFHKPEIESQRSKNQCSKVYGKRIKLFDRIWDSDGLLNENESHSMQKENVEISDDEEDCCIIAEIPRRKKPENTIAEYDPSVHLTTAKNSQSHRYCTSFISKNPPKPNENVREVKVIGDAGSISNSKLPVKKFFTTPRSSLSQGKQIKSRFLFRNHLRRRMNFLQESYRLTEKIQYIQLLQSHSINNLFTLRPPLRSISCKEIEVIDISDEKKSNKPEDQDVQILAEVSGIRSFQDILRLKPLSTGTLIKDLSTDCSNTYENGKKSPETICLESDSEVRQKTEALEEKLRTFMQISNEEVKNEEPYFLPELTDNQNKRIKNALIPEPKYEILSQGFGLKINRQDMQTLLGLNWLNDEIINFYMNLIMERSKGNSKLPKVYAFNTFFYPKLVSSGYSGLRRWTKQVDIFSFDMILVPIHLGMHWCLSVIDFRSKSVKFYDSVGSSNDMCLEKLLLYLKAESFDKKNKFFSTNTWKKVNVHDIPQQMNGGDCGVFSCMFAEHLARDCSILFTQDDMPYFRNKMVIEILDKKLLT